MENTGAIYGVSSLKYNGSALGLISEDGMQPGGDSPTKNRIWAAQKRNAPFAVIKGTPGTKMWTFTLIELLAENMVQVMGGTADGQGNYTRRPRTRMFRVCLTSDVPPDIPSASITGCLPATLPTASTLAMYWVSRASWRCRRRVKASLPTRSLHPVKYRRQVNCLIRDRNG